MAIGADTVWRVRTGGNAANGAAFDATISGAGTDYTQQDAAQLTLSDIACSASTTVTSATGGFTAAMIGNAIRITGGGATTGYYFITGHTDTNTITVDRTPGTVSAGSGSVGGATDKPWTILDSATAADQKIVAGNTVYIRGSGSDDPGADDYTHTTYMTPVAGTAGAGHIRIIGENGRPRLSSTGLMFYSCTRVVFRNIYFTASSNSNGNLGITHLLSHSFAYNCKYNLASQDMAAVTTADVSSVDYCEFYGGSDTPASGTYALIICGSYFSEIRNCHVHHSRNSGIKFTSAPDGGLVINTIVRGCFGDGIEINVAYTTTINVVYCVIDNNGGHGINYLGGEFHLLSVWNTILSNVPTGKVALRLSSGSTSVNDKKRFCTNYNAFYNNDSDYSNISAGDNDVALSASPYVSSTDFTLNGTAGGGVACKGAGIPTSIPGLSSTVVYSSIGLFGEPAGSSLIVVED